MLLQIKNLTVSVEHRALVTGVDGEFKSGEMVGLIGPSGSGKTTLLNTLGLLLPAGGGLISYDGDNATKWRRRMISSFWRERASFVFQDAGIDEDEDVLYNVTLKKTLRKRASNRGEALAALTRVGLSDRARDKARVLSGGEQRRIAIARAIYRQSSVIFADEPTASLDEENRSMVESLLAHEAERGALVIISTHDMKLARHCTSLINMGDYIPSNER